MSTLIDTYTYLPQPIIEEICEQLLRQHKYKDVINFAMTNKHINTHAKPVIDMDYANAKKSQHVVCNCDRKQSQQTGCWIYDHITQKDSPSWDLPLITYHTIKDPPLPRTVMRHVTYDWLKDGLNHRDDDNPSHIGVTEYEYELQQYDDPESYKNQIESERMIHLTWSHEGKQYRSHGEPFSLYYIKYKLQGGRITTSICYETSDDFMMFSECSNYGYTFEGGSTSTDFHWAKKCAGTYEGFLLKHPELPYLNIAFIKKYFDKYVAI